MIGRAVTGTCAFLFRGKSGFRKTLLPSGIEERYFTAMSQFTCTAEKDFREDQSNDQIDDRTRDGDDCEGGLFHTGAINDVPDPNTISSSANYMRATQNNLNGILRATLIRHRLPCQWRRLLKRAKLALDICYRVLPAVTATDQHWSHLKKSIPRWLGLVLFHHSRFVHIRLVSVRCFRRNQSNPKPKNVLDCSSIRALQYPFVLHSCLVTSPELEKQSEIEGNSMEELPSLVNSAHTSPKLTWERWRQSSGCYQKHQRPRARG